MHFELSNFVKRHDGRRHCSGFWHSANCRVVVIVVWLIGGIVAVPVVVSMLRVVVVAAIASRWSRIAAQPAFDFVEEAVHFGAVLVARKEEKQEIDGRARRNEHVSNFVRNQKPRLARQRIVGHFVYQQHACSRQVTENHATKIE